MIFRQIEPDKKLNHLIKSYWLVDSEGENSIQRQKIIPDGFTEIIFHYKEPFRINIEGNWQIQSKHLLAGQIRNHFFLENTGYSGMFGIKFKPAALTQLFDLEMASLTDKVLDLNKAIGAKLDFIADCIHSDKDIEVKVKEIDDFLIELYHKSNLENNSISAILDLILENKGMISIKEIRGKFEITERSLERLFQRYVGLSPKFYCRIIRFAHIFELIQQKDYSWADLSYLSGFFDQSHFIKNFKEFTGEEPSQYAFDEINMANFFLKKK